MWRNTNDLTFTFEPAGAKFQRIEEHATCHDRLIPLDAIALAGLGVLLAVRRRASP